MKPFHQDDQVTLWHGDTLKVLRALPDASIDCCVTSPPYFGLRDYGQEGQYGLEESPAAYVENLQAVFAEVRRILTTDGTLWLNLGDSYSTHQRGSDAGWDKSRLSNPGTVQKMQFASMRQGRHLSFDRPSKNLMGIPWRVAFALQDDGWILRNDIIWAKPNGMPESVRDRLTTRHEHVFLMSKSPAYHFDLDSIRVAYDGDRDLARRARTGDVNKENSVAQAWPPQSPIAPKDWKSATHGTPAARPSTPRSNSFARSTKEELVPGQAATQHRPERPDVPASNPLGRNPGDVWDIATQPFAAAHFAVMPLALAERCVSAGCKQGGVVIDPFSGSGTTGLAAARHGRRYVGIDLNAEYLELSLRTRLGQSSLLDGGDVA